MRTRWKGKAARRRIVEMECFCAWSHSECVGQRTAVTTGPYVIPAQAIDDAKGPDVGTQRPLRDQDQARGSEKRRLPQNGSSVMLHEQATDS